MHGHDFDQEIDLSGLLCPLPVLKARKRLAAMVAGQVLRVTTTDPMSALDIPHFCQEQGHTLLTTSKTDNSLTFWIRKK